MNIVEKDLLEDLDKYDGVFFTGNSTIKLNGALVMGRGFALQLRDKFPKIDLIMGRAITAPLYGVLLPLTIPKSPVPIGLFQVKYHFKDKALPDLIEYSARMLHSLIADNGKQYAMNYPGVGDGKLSQKAVAPILTKWLPSNITLYKIS